MAGAGREAGGAGAIAAGRLPLDVGPTQRAGQGGVEGDVPYWCELGVSATGLKGYTHFCPAA